MVKHTQTIRRLVPTNCLNVFHHFVGLALKGLNEIKGLSSNFSFNIKRIKESLLTSILPETISKTSVFGFLMISWGAEVY